jgi:ABC-2 type transport system permease protein
MLHKELLDLARSPATLLPMLFVSILAVAMPLAIAVVIPALTGEPLDNDADLARVAELSRAGASLEGDARIQLFFFEQFLIFFLLAPIAGAMTLAAHSVVGEKLARTLEPLLATPLRTSELLIAKALGAFLPTMVISLAALAVYFAAIGWLAAPGVIGGLISAKTAGLLGLVMPGVALVALQSALIVSSRVNDARTAQQFGVLIILPVIGAVVAPFFGVLELSARLVALAGLGLLGLWGLLLVVGVRLFRREAILTRWR